MDLELKKKLLQKKFSSLEYMQEMHDEFVEANNILSTCLNRFYNDNRDLNWNRWHYSDRPDGWEESVIGNFKSLIESLNDGLQKAQYNDLSSIESAISDIVSLPKDMDVMGEKWFDYIPEELRKNFWNKLALSRKKAMNIWWTLRKSWKNNEILNESITGERDERTLFDYL